MICVNTNDEVKQNNKTKQKNNNNNTTTTAKTTTKTTANKNALKIILACPYLVQLFLAEGWEEPWCNLDILALWRT